MHRWSKAAFAGLLFCSLTVAAQSVPLTVDHDPVPSPDPDPKTLSTQPSENAAQVTREKGSFTLKAQATEVRLNATVLENGRPVQTLNSDAFKVFEDGVPQTLLSFRHDDLPVSIGILIDSSGSMYDKRDAVSQAALDLVKLSNPQDEAFLVDFSDEAYIDQDFTSDASKLQSGLSFVKSAGGTAVYDAVVASADYLSKNAKHPKQVILLVTDGDDNASGSTLEEAIRRVQELDGPTIYCVGLLFGDGTSKSETRHARRVLETLAAQTGGIAYFPRKLEEVDSIAKEVAADVRQQYTLTYRSSKPASDGGYRTIHVEAKAKGYGRLDVRTRSGYFPKGAAKGAPAGGAAGVPDADLAPSSKHPN